MAALLGERINEFGNWAVTTYGLEFLLSSFPIEKERLDEDWEAVMEYKKEKFQLGFIEALEFARRYHPTFRGVARGAS